MQGYVWAKTPEGELFVVLLSSGKGYVPGVEGAISLDQFAVLEPVQWPVQIAPLSRLSDLSSRGALAPAATRASNILPFVANG